MKSVNRALLSYAHLNLCSMQQLGVLLPGEDAQPLHVKRYPLTLIGKEQQVIQAYLG
jgi:hypothetical protein